MRMPPPLPPSSKAPRRRKSNDKQEATEVAPPTSSRRYREDDVRPPASSRRPPRRTKSDILPPKKSSTTTTTTDSEIERIREIRERRKRAERGEDPDEISRPPRASMSREHLEKSGLLRRHRSHDVGDESSVSTNNSDASSTRSEIQARLAARRRQNATAAPRRHHSAASSISVGSSGDEQEDADKAAKRTEIQARLAARRRANNRMDGTTRYEPLHGEADATHDDDISSRRKEIQARLAAARLRRAGTDTSASTASSDPESPTPAIDRSDLEARLAARRNRRRNSGDGSKSAESQTSKDSESRNTSIRSEASNVSSEANSDPARSPSTTISERLRERREARERREKKEREKIDSPKVSAAPKISIESELTPSKSPIVVKSSRVGIESRKLERKIAANKLMTPEIDASGDWSVLLNVISAKDLPSNVVPNMPLCPVLKMGLVQMPAHFKDDLETNSATSVVMRELGDDGIESVNSAMTRSTTPKILSRRDNGAIDFHQEYRWDNLKEPREMGLCVELFARAVRTPTNYMLSPLSLSGEHSTVEKGHSSSSALASMDLAESPIRTSGGRAPPAARGVSRTNSDVSARTSASDLSARRGGLFNANSKQRKTEMEAAEAAAALARMLIDQGEAKDGEDSRNGSLKISEALGPDHDVSLRSASDSKNTDLTKDVRLGSVVIPLKRLPKGKSKKSNETVRLEQWHQLDTGQAPSDVIGQQKKPSVFLEISLSLSEVLDESEDELEEGNTNDSFKSSTRQNPSFSRRACIEVLNQTEENESKKEKAKTEDPFLEPGVVDFIAVVGCKDIGNQKNDSGMKGWVKTSPECVVLEQFPPNNEFHFQSGRKALLPEMLQWFCYPEGAKLWRGTAPPSRSELKLKRSSLATLPTVTSSISVFDSCLDCATSFSWFVIASNSDEYGSSLVKTYGAVIRFYVPAPTGIDSTQDDFAQAIMGGKSSSSSPDTVKRLWVPIAICLTSNLPIIGVMEALLLRTCEELANISGGTLPSKLEEIQNAIGDIILNYQKPIPGAVNCSVPFLNGDRFLLSLPPSTCLPPLPHGRAILSVCRLLGAEGLNYLLAAVLTECKILLHSEDIAEIAMVAEVITALTYPFAWSLPYIPVLPVGMIEFVEAPLSYLLGIPTCNLEMIDPLALDDTVVFDLNKKFSASDVPTEKLKNKSAGSKHPLPLPASVSTNVSNAVYKLLLAEEQMEEEFDSLEQSLPRLEDESLAEREFRVTVAVEICGMLRGYQDCVGAVFNRDKFLKSAPALYEERREYKIAGFRTSARGAVAETKKVLSSRSKRFLSSLVSGQNFQQFIESLDSDGATFFHEILETIDDSTSDRKTLKKSSATDEPDFNQADKNVAILMKSLQRTEDAIPTFCVEKSEEDETLLSLLYDNCKLDDLDPFYANSDAMDLKQQNPSNFMKTLLSPIEVESTTAVSDSGMQAVSMEYLTKLETTPWNYNQILDSVPQDIRTSDKLKLREAIGERRFRAWKQAQDKNSGHDDDLAFINESTAKQGAALDLTSLVTSAKNDTSDTSVLSSDTIQSRMSSLTPAQQRIAAAKSRDIIRRCLDRANVAHTSESDQLNPFMENGRDLMAEAEKSLRNPSAQLFLVSILAQRSRLDNNKRTRTMRQNPAVSNSASRLNPIAFECLIRLSCAMLDSCMEYKEFELAYRLLTNSAGFIMIQEVENLAGETDEFGNEESLFVISMTSRVGLHPIFADIGVWESVMELHLRDRKAVKKSDEYKSYGAESDDEGEEEEELEYDAAVATLYEMVGYGIPGEELSRFAMQASQTHGWFCDDRGRQLLMLARRISVRRDQAETGGAGNTGDIDMVRKGPDVGESNGTLSEGSPEEKPTFMWSDVAWCHPAAPSSSPSTESDGSESFMKRTPVTAIASFGSSIVASGGLDGGVFLAHTISFGSHDTEQKPKVNGIHLDWGSASRARTGSTSDGEYGVGAVSCLAVSYSDTSHDPNPSSTKDTKDKGTAMDIADSMEGSRIIAGTTAGDLRVWSVKDIYSSISLGKDEETRNSHSASRFKFSLRGRALSGHRGGVTCVDVPSQVYRPDSLVTGGADGLIKLWALRAPTGSRRSTTGSSNDIDTRGRGGDALSTLSGHSGRILSIKTAWHGDHLLSGGADRTIRVWDLATSGGKCIQKLSGHFGWITNVQYWGPNTIVSASTDRSVALWDARVRSSPLFILRNHQSPISDLLVGSRTDPYMVSAGADGTIATWDFRSLSDATADEQPGIKGSSTSGCKIVRLPSASIRHNANAHQRAVGSIHLSRDVTDPMNSFLSVGSDAILRKWSLTTGDMVHESPTGQCDTITSFKSFAQSNGFSRLDNSQAALSDTGFLTSSLDGTIRMRKFIEKRNE